MIYNNNFTFISYSVCSDVRPAKAPATILVMEFGARSLIVGQFDNIDVIDINGLSEWLL